MPILTRLRTVGPPVLIMIVSPVFAAGKSTAFRRPAAAVNYARTASAQDQTESPAPASPAPSAKPANRPPKPSHAYDFLIRGTVFTENALAFPGVQLRVRRAGEKKFHWETYTNSRGEFAVRVPQGKEYELAVHVKGFTDQTHAIDARTGDIQDDVVFRMEPAGGKK